MPGALWCSQYLPHVGLKCPSYVGSPKYLQIRAGTAPKGIHCMLTHGGLESRSRINQQTCTIVLHLGDYDYRSCQR